MSNGSGDIYTRSIEQHGGAKYLRDIVAADGSGKQIRVDVYAVIEAFRVDCPALQHALKKLLCPGQRGKGGRLDDIKGAMDALWRAKELEQNRSSGAGESQQAQPKVKRKRKPRLRIARAEMSEDRRALLDRMKELGINTRGKWQRSDAQLAEEIEAHLRQPQTTEA